MALSKLCPKLILEGTRLTGKTELAAASRLPVLRLDVATLDLAAQCERVADWLEATGGLHADY